MQKPRGTEDLFELKARDFFALEMIIRHVVDLYNYKEIRTPIFEMAELFKKSAGVNTDVVAKEMYIFNDKKNREFALRPEGTAPVVRAVLENKLYIEEKLPLKLFYFGQMFRYERPQNGRKRQFYQFGVELIGPDSIEADTEILCLAVNVLNSLGLQNYKVYINYLVIKEAREKYILDLKKQLSNLKLCDDCNLRIISNPLRILDCKIDQHKFNDLINMKEYLTNEQKQYYLNLIKSLNNLEIKVIEDNLLVRGLDYYTGFVFEIKDENGITLVGGGRYNNLVGELGGNNLPACGFAFGVERLITALENKKISISQLAYLDAYILAISERAKTFSSILLLMLRSAGFRTDYNFMNKNIKSAFKYSEKLNAKNIIIIGDKELNEGIVIIKEQDKKNEIKVKFEEIVTHISRSGEK